MNQATAPAYSNSDYSKNLNALLHMKSLRQTKLGLWTRIGDVFGRTRTVDYSSTLLNQYSKPFEIFLENWVRFATAELQRENHTEEVRVSQMEKIAATFISHSPELLISQNSEMSHNVGLLLGTYYIFHKSFAQHHASDDLQDLSLEKINHILQGNPEKHE